MKPISPEKFTSFHESFKGDCPSTAKLCFKCQGKCEKSQIGTLLPGEKEYMAQRMDLPLNVFTELYLDTLIVNGQCLDVLKLGLMCPFLTDDRSCACRAFKVVMCAVYPVMFSVAEGKTKFFLDSTCPLTHDPELARYFREVGIPALEALEPPAESLSLVTRYDWFDFDYDSIRRIRHTMGHQIFFLEDLLQCAVLERAKTVSQAQ